MSMAAYCSGCRSYVLVTEDGSCEAGHPKPMLRNLYDAEVDRKTGRPKPPRVRASVAGRRLVVPAIPKAPAISSPAVAATAAPVSPATVAAAVAEPAIAEPTAIPAAPFPDQVASPACVPAEESPLARLLGSPRGRHSAVVVEDPNRRAVALMMVALLLVAATVAAELAMGGDVLAALEQPAVIAMAG